jgi:lipoprotein-releasing system permease protein
MSGGEDKSKLSRPIVVISLTSIILGVAIMLITVSVITGFQEGIRGKVIGFGSHIQITEHGLNNSMESAPILIDQDFYPSLEEKPTIKKIQIFGYKPAILQSYRDSVSFNIQNKDTSRSSLDILGVLFKGIDQNYDWTFFEDKIIEGRIINFDTINKEVMISQHIANLMGYDVGDKCDAFFIRDNSGPKKQKFEIVGIYNSGFADFDKKLIFTQIHHIQKLNDWGVQTFVTLADTCINNQFVLKGITSGGSKSYEYNWGRGYFRDNYYPVLNKSGELKLISTDFSLNPLASRQSPQSVPDTAFINIQIDSICPCNEENLALVEYVSANEIKTPFGSVHIENGKGTHHLYTGGFEVLINDWKDLENLNELIIDEIPYNLKTTEITEMHRDIFAWLDLLDMNILIIIILILVVSLINMITSLLVLILEKTNMIGILKSMGGYNSSIRKIFIFNALFLLSRGLIWGNILGLGLLAFQYFTGFFSLNAEVYSLDTIPVDFNILHILYINLLTIFVCFLILIIPSYLVTKIDPIKAIRFD